MNGSLIGHLGHCPDAQILILEHIPERPTARFQAEALRAWMRPNLMTL